MRVNEILTESQAKTLEDNVARLEKVGGKVYTKITKGQEHGWLGVNGKGKAKVYFAFYPDGSSQRFETLPGANDLKSGFKADDLRDPETILADKTKADKLKKERELEEMYTKEITINAAELQKLCKAQHVSMGDKFQDAYVDGRGDRGLKNISGKTVATAKYTIYVYNEDYTEDEENGPEVHDPVYAFVWRDPKNPEKLLVKDVT